MNPLAVVVLTGVLALSGCRAAPLEVAPEASTTGLGSTSEATGTTPRGDRSIYALSMSLTDQDGRTVGLDVFRGKPVFIGMFYGTCPSACPLLISTIRRAMSELGAAADQDARVLLVSFDPQRDTPRALSAIVQQRGLDARWRLASAPDDQARELAALLGVRYERLSDRNFSHSSSVVLLDRTGAIDARLDDASQPLEPLVARAKALAGGK